jgi:ATP-dependent DNA helicase RecQ
MKVVIVAKTKSHTAAMTFDGRTFTLLDDQPCDLGDVWELTDYRPSEADTLHVQERRKLPPVSDLVAFIEYQSPPQTGGAAALFGGSLTRLATGEWGLNGQGGRPSQTAQFWRPNAPLRREEANGAVHYRHEEAIFPYTGQQAAPPEIGAGTLLRVALCPERGVAELTGWYDATAVPDEWSYADQPLFDEMETAVEPDSLPAAPTFSPDITPRQLLKQIFGYDAFRPLQDRIIESALAGRDTLTIMPTGSGKSLCFQLPALLWPGLTVVVSPLISLMQDQVAQLRQLGIPAATLNSSLPFPAYTQTVSDIRAGRVKLLYVAPETLLRPETLLLLEQVQVNCLTIDEAHCISEWGHDFRPEYRQLIQARQRMPQAVCMAVTATATERVREDIKNALNIPDAGTFIASFDRDNLHLAVEPKQDGLNQAIKFLDGHRGEAGIIYCSTRRQVDSLTEQLTAQGWPVLAYHAGLNDAARAQNQRRFIYEEGLVMVATIAFGMGINKSNVRFILHYDLPKNLEGYYQQIGRAGRDGLPADCLLLFSYKDVQTVNYFIQQEDQSQQAGSRQRLEAMVGFVETAVCRRRPLLAYFGERYETDSCDLCDNCLAEEEELSDLTIPAQKFLSCVKRTGEFFGMSHIIDVLRGSRSQKVLQKGHDRLSTYGIGLEFSKNGWQHLARQFLQQGLMAQDPIHGSLKLTPAAYAVFKGEKVEGILPERETAVTGYAARPKHDATLFEKLRAKRAALAQAADVPPYVIFSDRSLVDMATYFPQSAASFANMYGVGQAKLEKYADEFLPIIQDYCAERDIAESQPAATAVSPARRIAAASGKGRMEEVVEAFNAGQSVADLMAAYNVKQSTIISHLYNGRKAGLPLRAADELLELVVCSPDLRQRALDAFAELGPDYLRPVFDALEEQVSFDDLHLLRLHFIAAG